MHYPGEIIFPDYTGQGISSLLPEIFSRLGSQIRGQPGLSREIIPEEIFKGVKRIVLILIDALGYNTLNRFRRKQGVSLLDHADLFSRLTSVTPSTTSTSLCTLSTGVPPGIHGIVGYRLLLSRNELVDIISFKRAYSDLFIEIDPEDQMCAPPAYPLLTSGRACILTRDRYATSPFSRMIYRGCDVRTYFDFSDLCVLSRRVIPKYPFTYIYWDMIDTLGHIYGVNSEETFTEIEHIDRWLSEELIETSPPGTLFLITADHGQIDTAPARRERFNDHPDMIQMLRSLPGGDSRLPYLYVKRGKIADVIDYVKSNMKGVSSILERRSAVASGIFGEVNPSPEVMKRIGDIIIIPRGNWKFVYFYKEGQRDLIGRHGGLSEDEMYVPLIAIRR